WSPVGPRDTEAGLVAIAPTTPRRIVAVAGTHGILVSPDDGATWDYADGLSPGDSYISIAFDPVDPSIVYAGAREGDFGSDTTRLLRASFKGGPTLGWMSVQASRVITVATAPPTIYALDEFEIHRSVDHGDSWDSVRPALPFEWWRGLWGLA